MLLRSTTRLFSTRIASRLSSYTQPRSWPRTQPQFAISPSNSVSQRWSDMSRRGYATTSSADAAIEEIQELYATAKDEFEIAAEETEKKTVYAEDDRAAAQEEIKKLKQVYENHIKQSDPQVAEEIQRRVGQRIREISNAMIALEESAMED